MQAVKTEQRLKWGCGEGTPLPARSQGPGRPRASGAERATQISQLILLQSQDNTLTQGRGANWSQCSRFASLPVALLLYFLHLSGPGHGDLGSWPALLVTSKWTKRSDYNHVTRKPPTSCLRCIPSSEVLKSCFLSDLNKRSVILSLLLTDFAPFHEYTQFLKFPSFLHHLHISEW